jgi:hypothetical protein
MTANTSFIRSGPAALALAWALAFAAPASAEVAGKVLFVAGSVTLERTPPVALKAGDLVETGTVIATGEKSRAQILMNDGARVALRASSRYRVDEFGLPAAVGAPTQVTTTRADGVSVATLLKGGFRSSTGAIGKDGAGTYEVRTPIGTLGIRGTDYTAIWCQGDCNDAPGLSAANAARNGMYLATHAGSIAFRYGGREAVVNAGEVVFIASADALPEPLEQLPAWVIEDGAGRLETGAQAGDAKGGVALPDLAVRRPPPTGQQPPPDSTAPDPKDAGDSQGVQRPIIGTVGGQQQVDLTSGQLPRGPNDPPPGTPSVPPPSNNVPPPTPPPGGN